jgi:hypothetical protein
VFIKLATSLELDLNDETFNFKSGLTPYIRRVRIVYWRLGDGRRVR